MNSILSPNQKQQGGQFSPAATVVVPTYCRTAYLSECISSLLQQYYQTNHYEIIVVNNNSTGDVQEITKNLESQWHRPIRYMQEPETGLHNARHKGAKEAVGDILVYIDDDVILQSGWLEAIVHPFTDPRVAIVGGKVLPKWEVEPPGWLSQFPPTYLSLLDLGEDRRELLWPEGVYGCNMAVRRSALYEVGGFNPDAMGDRRLIWLRGDGETGLHKKIYDAGYKVIYEPQAAVYHQVPASRLQPDYFYWRAFIQGISDSYTHMRDNRLPVVRILGQAVRCMTATFRAHVRSLRDSGTRIRSRAQAHYWYGKGQHQLRMALSPALRSHVLQETYLK